MIPVQAKGEKDQIGIVQMTQDDIRFAEQKFPGMRCRAIAAQSWTTRWSHCSSWRCGLPAPILADSDANANLPAESRSPGLILPDGPAASPSTRGAYWG